MLLEGLGWGDPQAIRNDVQRQRAYRVLLQDFLRIFVFSREEAMVFTNSVNPVYLGHSNGLVRLWWANSGGLVVFGTECFRHNLLLGQVCDQSHKDVIQLVITVEYSAGVQ